MSHLRAFRHAWGNGSRWRILAVALAVSLCWAAAIGVWLWRQPPPFAPLAYQTAPQTVLGQQEIVTVGGVKSSVVVLRWDGHSPVAFESVGSKCNNSPGVIKKKTERLFASVSPTGSVVPDGGSVVDMIPGCTTRTAANPYLNVVPLEVLERARVLSQRTGERITLWQYRGIETPFDGNGNPGVPAYWQSDSFGIEVP